MYIDSVIISIFGVLTSLAIGVIGFFLKRLINKTDNFVSKSELDICIEKNEKLSAKMDNCADKNDMEMYRNETKNLADKFATKDELNEIKTRMDKIEKSLDYIKEHTVRKDDFVRSIASVERKIDDILTYLRDGKGN